VTLVASACQIEQHPDWRGDSSAASEYAPDAGASADESGDSETSQGEESAPIDESEGSGEVLTTLLEAGPDLQLVIPDGDYDGTLLSMACHQMTAPPNGFDRIGSVELELGIVHPWLGDLVMKLRSPMGQVVTVMSRPGVIEPFDDGQGQFSQGTHARLVKEFPINFNDESEFDAEGMGMELGPMHAACRDDGICDYHPNAGAGPGRGLDDFHGEVAAGTWLVCVGDSGDMDQGSVDRITLTLDRVRSPD